MTDLAELDRLLAEWAAHHRLTDLQASELRSRVLAAPQVEKLDADWLWSLLRPVTALLDRLDDEPRQPTGIWTTYLQLA